MRANHFASVTALALAVSIQGCNSHMGCILLPQEGLRLQVEDAGTRRSLRDVAVVTISRVSPPPVVSKTGPITPGTPDNPLLLTMNRPGTYNVTASVPGYRNRTERVTVEQNETFCMELKTVDLTLKLEPSA